jgi:antitoxin component YwqK of YwqJK toxin-antitoxin module
MKHKTILIYLVTYFISLPCFSQTKYVYYFDANLKTTDKSKSVSTGSGTIENSLLKLYVSDNLTKQPVLIAFFTDSSLAVKQGLFQSFFKSGLKESEGNYENNIENGCWKKWDSTGHLIDSTIYDHGKKMDITHFSYNKNGSLSQYGFEDIKNDTAHYISYNDSGKKISEVSFVGQKGIVTRYNDNTIQTDTVFTRKGISASYPGGDVAWTKYISDRLIRNYNKLIRDQQTGTCWVRFMIDTDGKIRNVQATTMQGSTLAKIAVDIISNGPKWKPAMLHGRLLKAYRIQPVGLLPTQ